MSKNQEVIKTIHPFGSAFKIQVRGNPAEIVREVSRLFNFGIVTGSDGRKKMGIYGDRSPFPESFRAGTDDTVTVNSYPKAFEKGLKAMATVETRAIMKEKGLRRPSTFRNLRALQIGVLREQFIRGENLYSSAPSVSSTTVPMGEQV